MNCKDGLPQCPHEKFGCVHSLLRRWRRINKIATNGRMAQKENEAVPPVEIIVKKSRLRFTNEKD